VSPFDRHWNPARALLLSLVLVAVCYANSLSNAFILDDILIVAANERIRHVQPIQFLLQPYWGDLNHAGIYRPLTIFSFSLEYPIWGVWAPGYRLINLLLHALNGWLVYMLARSLLGSPVAAIAASVVYVIHPMQTEAVVSIVGRSELLAAALFFTAWLAFRKERTVWSAVAYFFALLAKESAITFPLIAMVEMALGAGGIQKVRQSWRRFGCLAAAGLGYLCLRSYVLGGLGIPKGGQYLNGTLTLAQRWMTSGRVFIQYFRLLFAPVRVTGDYDFNSIPLAGLGDWDAWLGLALVLGCMIIAAVLARRRPAVTLGILFFFLTLLPVSNWIIPIALLMAERFLYMPAFGFALISGIMWAGISSQNLRRLVAAGVVTVAIIVCMAHNYIWQDTLTFHKNAVEIIPNNARARLGYGFALLRLNRNTEAKDQFEAGLEIMPWSAPLSAGLARTVQRITGRCDQARPLLARSLSIQPGQWQSLWLLGDCLQMEGRMDQAEQTYALAVQNADFPDAELLASWGRTLKAMGKTPSAIAAYKRAALINPNNANIQAELKQLTQSN
jgi:protein O-mannosyl-transferase